MSDETLIAAAREAALGAYVPYSRFHVGAAVRTADGRLFAAPNVENASYGLSLCAETNAIMAAVTAGARRIVSVAVVGYPEDNPQNAAPAMPCGRCRQVMKEFADDDCRIIAISPGGGDNRIVTLGDLLPYAFGPADLD